MGAYNAFQRRIHSGSFYLRDSTAAFCWPFCPFGANGCGLFPEFEKCEISCQNIIKDYTKIGSTRILFRLFEKLKFFTKDLVGEPGFFRSGAHTAPRVLEECQGILSPPGF